MQFLGGLRPNAWSGSGRQTQNLARSRAPACMVRLSLRRRIYGHARCRQILNGAAMGSLQFCAQYASIFRLLLKVAVSVTHQCALSNFCKASCLYFFATPPCGRRPWPAPGRKKVLSAAHVGSRPPMRANIWTRENLWFPDSAHRSPYLLSLLAMIKCSICSYQCDN